MEYYNFTYNLFQTFKFFMYSKKFFINFFICIIFPLIFSTLIYSQNKNNLRGISLLDSVKTIYGDSCEIGVNSSLIMRLYKYKSLIDVNGYLMQYENIRNKIITFRKDYYQTIENDPALLLDANRIFKNQKMNNIINACGIYFGPDSVTDLVVSYTIVRSNVASFYLKTIQLLNFDKTFKKELTQNGADWFYSEKLKEIKNVPFKIFQSFH